MQIEDEKYFLWRDTNEESLIEDLKVELLENLSDEEVEEYFAARACEVPEEIDACWNAYIEERK